MTVPTDNATWLIETGDAVIRKKAGVGVTGLTQWELLVYCLWVTDYGMRNAGDLDIAEDVYSTFHPDARQVATELKLPQSLAAFSLARHELEQQYFDRFNAVCEEIRSSSTAFEVYDSYANE